MDIENEGLEVRVREGVEQQSGVQSDATPSEVHSLNQLLKVGFVSIALMYGIKGIADTTDSDAPAMCAVEYLAFCAPILFTYVVGRYLGKAVSLDELKKNRGELIDREAEEEINREAQRHSKQYATINIVLGGALAAFSYGSGRFVGCLIQYT